MSPPINLLGWVFHLDRWENEGQGTTLIPYPRGTVRILDIRGLHLKGWWAFWQCSSSWCPDFSIPARPSHSFQQDVLWKIKTGPWLFEVLHITDVPCPHVFLLSSVTKRLSIISLIACRHEVVQFPRKTSTMCWDLALSSHLSVMVYPCCICS